MGRQRRFLAVMAVLALAGAALQAATGDAQLVLHFTPLFLLGGLLLAGRYVGEDRIVARWRAAVARPRVRQAPVRWQSTSSARSAPCSSVHRARCAVRRRRSLPPPDATALLRAAGWRLLPPASTPDDANRSPDAMLRRTCAVALAVLATAAPAASAHQGNPNYLIQVNAVTPRRRRRSRVEVLNRDDRLLLRNTSGRDVVVEGYERRAVRPRAAADGTVEVNTDSPAYYLNEDRFGDVAPPAERRRQGRAALEGAVDDRPLRVARPPHALDVAASRRQQVADATEQTKIFDWRVPVAGRRAAGRDRRHAVLDAAAGAAARPLGAIVAPRRAC